MPDKNTKKHAGGRPQTHTEESFDKLALSLQAWVTKRYAEFKKKGTGEMWLGDFAFEEGLSRSQLSEFADPNGDYKGRNAKFCKMHAWAKTAQESWAIFDEKINVGMRKLVLVNHHHYKDKAEVEHTGGMRLVHQYELPKKTPIGPV